MDAYDRCTNLEKTIQLILLSSMVEAWTFQTTHVFCFSYMYGSTFILKENLRLMCVFIQATRFYFTLFIVL